MKAIQTSLDFGEKYQLPFTEQHIYSLELPFEVKPRLAKATERFYNTFNTDKKLFETKIFKYLFIQKHSNPKFLSAMGIIAEYADRNDFALALYKESGNIGYKKHLEWKMAGSNDIDSLVSSLFGYEADEVSKIFRRKKDIKTSNLLILKAANDLSKEGQFLTSASFFSKIEHFDEALTDLKKYVSELEIDYPDNEDYKKANIALMIARTAKKRDYPQYEKFYDAAIEIYSKLKNKYMIGRIYTELGKKFEALEIYNNGKCFFNSAILEKHLNGCVSFSTARKMIAQSLEKRIVDVKIGDANINTYGIGFPDEKTAKYARRFGQEKYLYNLLLKRLMISSAHSYASTENMQSEKTFLDEILKKQEEFDKITEGTFIWRSYLFSDPTLFIKNAMDDYVKLDAKDHLLSQRYVEKCISLENGTEKINIFVPGLIEVPKEFEYYFVLKRIFGRTDEFMQWNNAEFYYLIGNRGIDAVRGLHDSGHHLFLSDALDLGTTYQEYEFNDRLPYDEKQENTLREEIARHKEIKKIQKKSLQKSKRKWNELGITGRN